MKKEVFNKIETVSILLKQKLEELDKCQKEKEKILAYIDELQKNNELEEKYPVVKVLMDKNLNEFRKIVADIKKLNEIEF